MDRYYIHIDMHAYTHNIHTHTHTHIFIHICIYIYICVYNIGMRVCTPSLGDRSPGAPEKT